jgi:hypothetical protein
MEENRAVDDSTVLHELELLAASLGPGVYTRIDTAEHALRLICASKVDRQGRVGGNSFWVTLARGRWYLATWAPNYYACPPDADVTRLCTEVLAASEVPLGELTAAMREAHSLTEVHDIPEDTEA